MKNKNDKKSLRKMVSKIFLAQPISGMKPERVSDFLLGNFDAKIAPAVIEIYLKKNNPDGLIDIVVNEMMKEPA